MKTKITSKANTNPIFMLKYEKITDNDNCPLNSVICILASIAEYKHLFKLIKVGSLVLNSAECLSVFFHYKLPVIRK